jgi:hypothetical protein
MAGGRINLAPSRGSDLTLLVAGAPGREGGVGGWESSERALRRPAKWWKASPDDTMSLELIIDIDKVGGPSVERRIRVLRDMGQAGDHDEPPTITVTGDVWQEDQAIEWVMQGLTLGDRLYNSDGTLRRQAVTVSLERYEELDTIEPVSVKGARGKKGKRRRRVVVARGNDTLRAVALRELGDATRWKDLQRWNKAKLKGVDPDARLRTGTHLTVR